MYSVVSAKWQTRFSQRYFWRFSSFWMWSSVHWKRQTFRRNQESASSISEGNPATECHISDGLNPLCCSFRAMSVPSSLHSASKIHMFFLTYVFITLSRPIPTCFNPQWIITRDYLTSVSWWWSPVDRATTNRPLKSHPCNFLRLVHHKRIFRYVQNIQRRFGSSTL